MGDGMATASVNYKALGNGFIFDQTKRSPIDNIISPWTGGELDSSRGRKDQTQTGGELGSRRWRKGQNLTNPIGYHHLDKLFSHGDKVDKIKIQTKKYRRKGGESDIVEKTIRNKY